MSDTVLRCMLVAVLLLTACGKNDGNKPGAASGLAAASGVAAQARVYGKEDAECFAGIVRASDAKHVSPADFKTWKDKLGSQDKEWLSGFAGFYATVTRAVTSHIGRPPQDLYDAKLINKEQQSVIEGYLAVAQEGDAAKADSMAASACASIGFTKGPNFN